MRKFLNNKSLQVSAAIFIGMVSGVQQAHATDTDLGGNSGDATFSTIANTMTDSISGLPGLLTGVSYMMGILLGVLGILKIKDHVENPGNTPLQHGAIRLAAGGGLFALPIVYQAMLNTIGDGGDGAGLQAELQGVQFGVTGGTDSGL